MKEMLTKKLSIQDVYVDLVPSFFTESCKWKRESLAQFLSDCKPNAAVQFPAYYC